MTQEHVAFIGGGNMAEALLKGFLAKGLLEPQQVTVCDVVAERREFLSATYGVNVSAGIADALGTATTVLLAVKPQQFSGILPEVAAASNDALIISIAAGVTLQTMTNQLGGEARLVRVMPNTPALVGEGIAGFCGNSNATPEDLKWTSRLLASVGKALEVEESGLHAVTALSGSGPAYVFYAMEAMLEGAKTLGVDAGQAKELVLQTFKGAAVLAEQSEDSPGELRRKVTSKGGTTAAALAEFDAQGVGDGLAAGVCAAAKRSRELAGEE